MASASTLHLSLVTMSAVFGDHLDIFKYESLHPREWAWPQDTLEETNMAAVLGYDKEGIFVKAWRDGGMEGGRK